MPPVTVAVGSRRRGEPAIPDRGPSGTSARGASRAPPPYGIAWLDTAAVLQARPAPGGLGVRPRRTDEDEAPERSSQASMTAVTQRPRPTPADRPGLPFHEIRDPNKSRGVQGEVTVPFDRYPGWDWNHLGGGGETASSRTNLARRSSHDERIGQEGTAGLDFLVENVRTGRLVIGEQKATQGAEFSSASAITTSLELNIEQAVKTLRGRLDSGAIQHPEEVTRLRKTIERLEATHAALKTGRAGKPAELPEGVVFELTNLGGEGRQIGKEHVDRLAKEYGESSAFLEHLLGRTFVRDAALAKSRGRDPGGQRGTDADPEIVPATDILTEPARDELARRRAGKSEKQWKADKVREKQNAERAEQAQRAAARKAQSEQRGQAETAARQKAAEIGEQARAARLKQLQEERAALNEPEPSTKRLREQAANKLKADAEKVGRKARDAEIDRFKTERKNREEAAQAQKKADEAVLDLARQRQRESEHQARSQREAQERLALLERQQAAKQTDEHGALKTPESLPKMNEEARARQAAARRDAQLSQAAHLANQAAAGVRAYDAYDEARAQGKGRAEAAFDAGKTWLDNTNPVFGAVNTYRQRIQKDASGQQFYGDDEVDAMLGTLGETGAGFLVPGSGLDQAVNGGANLVGAVDDHLARGRGPGDPAAGKATLRTATDLAADLTPSRMAAQTLGGGARAIYDVARFTRGDARGVDKFGEDAVRGKLGAIVQPWAMAADFVGNLGGDSAGVALDKTLKKTEGTTLKKIGDAGGDAMYELGQSKVAKSGQKGMAVQGISMTLGITSDIIGGKSFDRALNDAAEAGKGSLADTVGSALGEGAYKAVEKGKEIVNEDLPAAKKKLEQKIDQTRADLSAWWKKL